MLHRLRYEPEAEAALHRLLTSPRLVTLAQRVESELALIAADPGRAKGHCDQLRLPIAGRTVWRRHVRGSGEERVVLWVLHPDGGAPLILGILDPDALA